MKKILLFLVLSLSVLCFVSCGGAKKDPEVVKFIIDKINNDINNIKNTPAKERTRCNFFKNKRGRIIKKYKIRSYRCNIQ